MVWSCEKGNGGKSVEISGGNGSIGKRGSRKTKENLERYSEEELLGGEENVTLDDDKNDDATGVDKFFKVG